MLLKQLAFISIFFLISGCGHFSTADKENAELYLRIGTSELNNGAYPQALASLRKAAELDPENPVIQNNLGLAYYVRNRFETAEKHIKKAIELKNDYSDARNNLGRVLIDLGKYQEAIKELKIVTQDLTYVYPEKPLLNIGIAYFSIKNYQDSKFYILKAISIQSNNCLARNYLGRVHYEERQYKVAVDELDKAIGFCQNQGFDEPYYYSGLSYYHLGNKDKALARLEDIEKLFPTGAYKQKAKDIMKEIRK